MENTILESDNELTEINEGQIITSSRLVAEKFNKQHKHVLDSINEILAAENSAARLFYESTYESRGKQYPQYLMNRDGFSLLAMGFTGKKALAWKFKFIKAFNDMEAALKANTQTPVDQIVDTFNLPTTLKDAYLRLAAYEDEKTLLLEQKEHLSCENNQVKELNNELIPKAEMFDILASTNDYMKLGDVAKLIAFKDMGRDRLFRFLERIHIIINTLEPYQSSVDRGYVKMIEYKYPAGKKMKFGSTMYFSHKGIEMIIRRLLKEGYAPNDPSRLQNYKAMNNYVQPLVEEKKEESLRLVKPVQLKLVPLIKTVTKTVTKSSSIR